MSSVPETKSAVLLAAGAALAENEGRGARTVSRVKREASCPAKFQMVPGHSACLPQSETPGSVSDADKVLIVKMHNDFRASANPTARNMLRMRWDDEVAMVAQKKADSCRSGHEKDESQRSIPGRFTVGQNLARGQRDWTGAINAWHKEVQHFSYGATSFDLSKIGHYTAIMWATTTLIGCGMNACGGSHLYICNYAPAGNMRGKLTRPYEQGPSCADCPGHCSDKLCDCDLTCLNYGSLNLTSCACRCYLRKSPFNNQHDCSVNCKGTSDPERCKKGVTCEKILPKCAHTCKFCPYVQPGYSGPGASPSTGSRLQPSVSPSTMTLVCGLQLLAITALSA